MSSSNNVLVRAFRPDDQEEVKELILSGLEEHWGTRDVTKNPDLYDISASYADATFLVAVVTGRIVGTGALVLRPGGTAEIVRMSVARDLRRQGVGSLILRDLIQHARNAGVRRIMLETAATWVDVIAFYHRNGFTTTHHMDGDVYFALDLDGVSPLHVEDSPI